MLLIPATFREYINQEVKYLNRLRLKTNIFEGVFLKKDLNFEIRCKKKITLHLFWQSHTSENSSLFMLHLFFISIIMWCQLLKNGMDTPKASIIIKDHCFLTEKLPKQLDRTNIKIGSS